MVVIVSVGTFILYLETLIREAGWGDSAELSLVAYQLGLTHPPGYPLHSILAKLFSLFFAEPAIATNLMSAVCTSLAAGILSLIIFDLTDMVLPALLVPFVFSTLPNIWDMAVVTEVYNVNIFILGCSIFLFLRSDRGNNNKYFLGFAVCFGLSLGTYKANLLLLPAFLLAIMPGTPFGKVWKRLLVFCSIVGSIFLLFMLYAVIRAHAALAINYPLNSIQEIIAYGTGANLRPAYPHALGFYVDRTVEHFRLFAANFLYLPILLGGIEAVVLFKEKKLTGFYIGIIFAINYLFFSYYAVSDYFTMPPPAYFIYCIWVGCSFALLSGKSSMSVNIVNVVGIVVCVLVIGFQLYSQLPARIERARTYPVTELVLPALLSFPENSVVISRWERYAPMLYFQQIRKMREDVTLVVSYDYLNQINSFSQQDSQRSILIDNNDTELRNNYQIKRYYRRWFLIVAPK